MNDDILDILVAHGVPGTTIVRIAQLIADVQRLQKLETEQIQRRDEHAAYMREWRVKSRELTLDHVKSPNVPLSSIPPITKKEVSKRERGTRLPNEWQPDADDCTYAIDLGLVAQTIATDFRDYWHAAPVQARPR